MNAFIVFFGEGQGHYISTPKPCGGIWFLRSDVHCDAGLLFFGAVAAQHRARPEDESHCRQNGGIPKQVGRACLQGHDEIGRSNRQNETLAVWQPQVVRRNTGRGL